MHGQRGRRQTPTNRTLWTCYALGAVSGAALGALGHELWSRRAEDLTLYQDVRDLVRQHYVEEVVDEQLVDDALAGMLAGLDPYSRFYARADLVALDRETSGTFTGIGVVFQPPTSDLRVLFPTPGSPAEGKFRVGDRILALDGASVADFAPGELQERVGASGGRELAFELEARDGTRRTELVTPELVLDPTVRHARMIEGSPGVGYCAITAFSHETPAELDQAVAGLRELGMEALVLDLRANGGGILQAAVTVANRFIAEGVIVSTRARRDSRAVRADPEEAELLGLPLVVLADGASASASEVLIGALQDHRVGAIVGEPTFGKGMVQTLQPFGERAVAKLTTALYTTPANRQIDRNFSSECAGGLEPDLHVPIDEAERRGVWTRLARFSPPPALLPELEAWEREEGLDLLPPWPEDRQLAAAVALFEDDLGAVLR